MSVLKLGITAFILTVITFRIFVHVYSDYILGGKTIIYLLLLAICLNVKNINSYVIGILLLLLPFLFQLFNPHISGSSIFDFTDTIAFFVYSLLKYEDVRNFIYAIPYPFYLVSMLIFVAAIILKEQNKWLQDI